MRGNVFAAGPLVPNRLSFSGEIEGSSSEDPRGIAAVTPQGPFIAALVQPFDNRDISAREGVVDEDHLVSRLVSRR